MVKLAQVDGDTFARLAVSALVFLGASGLAEGCTYTAQKDAVGNVVVARSMEFEQGLFSSPDLDLLTNLSYYPRGTAFSPVLEKGSLDTISEPKGTNNTSNDTSTVSNQYAFVAIDQTKACFAPGLCASSSQAITSEGMNEYGFGISALVLKMSQYEAAESKNTSVTFLDFPAWALGNVRSVAELRGLLQNSVAVTACETWSGIDDLLCKFAPNTHFAVEDASGETAVIEYLNGELRFTNNSVGTLTNDPNFEYMTQNLAQYKAVLPFEPPSTTADIMAKDGVEPASNTGWNQWGMPGDATPVSRFVRVYLLRAIAAANAKPKTTEQVMVQQQAIISAMTLPFGAVAEPKPQLQEGMFDYTVWAVLKVPHRSNFYFRDYKQMQWQRFNLLDPVLRELREPIHKSMQPPSNTRNDPLGTNDITNSFFKLNRDSRT